LGFVNTPVISESVELADALLLCDYVRKCLNQRFVEFDCTVYIVALILL